MKLNSKQRAFLKSLAMNMDPVYQIGKSDLTPEVTRGIEEALKARELIKINVLKTVMTPPQDIAGMLSERTKSEVVQVIGRKIVLYRQGGDKKKKIELP